LETGLSHVAQACFAIHLMEATMNIDNTIIYRVLNFGAKSWWASNQLRDMGKHVEARREERRNILSDLETVRSALYIPVSSALATCDSKE